MPQDTDVPAQQESTVEDRLTAFFMPQKAAPRPQPQQPAESPVSADEPAVEEASAEEQVSAEDTDAEDQPEDQQQDGFVELEHLGKKYRVDPDLKTAFEANRAMGTKATMELAPVRKSLEIEKMALNATKAFEAEVKDIVQQQAQLRSYKDQAGKLNWAELTLDQKVDLDRELRNIDSQISTLENQMSAKKQEHNSRFGQFVVHAVAETVRYMAQKVPNWNVDTGKALNEYGQNYGIPPEKLTAGWFSDPVATHIMWKAQQWDKLQGSRPSVQNKASNAPPVSKPGSSDVQKSVSRNKYQEARQNLKKTGSLDAFASALLVGQKQR